MVMESCFSIQGLDQDNSIVGTAKVHAGKHLLLVSFSPSALSRPHLCPQLLLHICFLGSTGGVSGMMALPAPIPAHLFSEALWLAQGVMISGKSTRGGWWTAGVSLRRENNQSSVANSRSKQRDYTATAHTHLGRSDGVTPNTIFIGMDRGREAHVILPQHNMVVYFG